MPQTGKKGYIALFILGHNRKKLALDLPQMPQNLPQTCPKL